MTTKNLELNKYELALIKDALELQKKESQISSIRCDCAELIDLVKNTISEIENEDPDPIECDNCAGSGEGSHDGSTCIVCNGSGNI